MSGENPSASVLLVVSSRALMTEAQVELRRGLQEHEWHPSLFHDLCFEANAKYSNDFKMETNEVIYG